MGENVVLHRRMEVVNATSGCVKTTLLHVSSIHALDRLIMKKEEVATKHYTWIQSTLNLHYLETVRCFWTHSLFMDVSVLLK